MSTSKRRSPYPGSLSAALAALLSLATACGSTENASSDPQGDPGQVAQPTTPPPDPTTCRGAPYPLILAHGMAGFASIGPLNYFFNVSKDLTSRGEQVYESQVSPYESSQVRGNELARFVDTVLAATGRCKVDVIAHSQGGIDARYVISTLHYGDRIGGLVTVSTPHAGTPIADVALGLVPGFSADVVNAILLAVQGLTSNQQGNPNVRANLEQLSTPSMARFNAQNLDDPRVRYYSVAGRSNLSAATAECKGSLWPNPAGLDLLNPLLALPGSVWTVTSPDPFRPIPNDGLVPVASARWGTFLGCVPADHFDEVGQIAELGPDLLSGFYHIDLYRQIVAKLHQDGL